jgi:hypothetical protein
MTNEHPITPPPELVHQWVGMLASMSDQAVFTMVAQWGADQELEACCKWLFESAYPHKVASVYLRTVRRPPVIPEIIEVDGHTYQLVNRSGATQ